MEIFSQSFAFLTTLVLAFLLPGFVLWRALFGRTFSRAEELFFSFIGSIILVDLLMLIYSRISIPLSGPVISGTLFFITLLAGAYAWKQGTLFSGRSIPESFSPKMNLLILTILILAVFIRTIFLSSNMLPTATDLGHHMYWSAVITETEAIPPYEKIEVVTNPETGASLVAPPKPIADFIIGEHLPFALFHSLSGLSFQSAFPILFLHLINLLSVIAVVLLAYRLAEPLAPKVKPEWVAIAVLLLLGPLFALASPQAKFVSGGVVGNLFGNLFIPAILLLFYRAFADRKSLLFAAAIVLSFFLAYTHHLSTLVLAFILVGTGVAFVIGSLRTKEDFVRSTLKLVISPSVLATLFFAFAFMALVALPSYLDTKAIDSAIGTPTKTTRTGLSFFQVSNSIGGGKVALGVIGLAFGLFTLFRRPLPGALIFAWGATLLVMALFPHWLFLDIPSGRVGSYLAYPIALAGGFALAWLIQLFIVDRTLPRPLTIIAAASLFAFVIGTGSSDNAGSLTDKDRSYELVQTIAATEYLADHTDGAMILKDHNYLSADAWMKLSFLKDYGYPLSRGLFGRYEEGGNRRERCTLAMISTPNTEAGVRCYDETGVRYLVVNPVYDRAQFEKSDSFSKLYTSQTAAIFERLSH